MECPAWGVPGGLKDYEDKAPALQEFSPLKKSEGLWASKGKKENSFF